MSFDSFSFQILKLKKMPKELASTAMGCKRSFDVMKSKEEKAWNIVRESKSWFLASFLLWFIGFSFLFIGQTRRKTQPKTLLRNFIESTQRYFGQVVFYLTFDYNSIDFDIYEERLQHNWKYLQVELAVGLALTLLLAKTRFQLSTFMLKWHLWQHLT